MVKLSESWQKPEYYVSSKTQDRPNVIKMNPPAKKRTSILRQITKLLISNVKHLQLKLTFISASD